MKLGILWTLSALLCASGLAWGENPEITGKGTVNFLPQFTSRTTLGNSILFQGPGGSVGVGTTGPAGRLDVASNFAGGGPTLVIENFDANGDDAIDFHSGGGFVGNVGFVVTEQAPPHFFILQNSDYPYPLTLAENGGNVGIGTADPTNILTVQQGRGPAIADGWAVYSSKRWKSNVERLDGALEKVEHLNGVSFSWKSTGKRDIGLIAEEVAPVVPEAVSLDEHSNPKAVDYSRLTPLLVEAIKEQQSEIARLRRQVAELAHRSAGVTP